MQHSVAHEVQLDFQADYLSVMSASLRYWDFALPTDRSFESIAHAFHNAWRRNVAVRRRWVHQAANLSIPPQRVRDYERLIEKFESGADMHLHMSRTILDASYEDALFNDWRIQHFHFFERPDRDDHVVYAIVDLDEVYIVGVFRHDAFSHRELLEVVHANWPDLIARFRIHGARPERGPISNKEIKQRRDAGIMSLLELSDGSVYFSPGGGITSARTSVATSKSIQWTIARLRESENAVRVNVDLIHANIVASGRVPGSRFRLLLRGNQLWALETKSHTAHELGPLFEPPETVMTNYTGSAEARTALLHELGHAYVARSLKIAVNGIVLPNLAYVDDSIRVMGIPNAELSGICDQTALGKNYKPGLGFQLLRVALAGVIAELLAPGSIVSLANVRALLQENALDLEVVERYRRDPSAGSLAEAMHDVLSILEPVIGDFTAQTDAICERISAMKLRDVVLYPDALDEIFRNEPPRQITPHATA